MVYRVSNLSNKPINNKKEESLATKAITSMKMTIKTNFIVKSTLENKLRAL